MRENIYNRMVFHKERRKDEKLEREKERERWVWGKQEQKAEEGQKS